MTTHLSAFVLKRASVPSFMVATVLVAQTVQDEPELLASLRAAGLTPSFACEDQFAGMISSAGAVACAAVVFDCRGLPALSMQERMVARFGALGESGRYVLSLVLVDQKTDDFNQGVLPPRAQAISLQVSPDTLSKALAEHRQSLADRSPAARAFAVISGVRSTALRKAPQSSVDMPIPNFNVKHPSMIVPIAFAARDSGMPVYCQISPQEAIAYHPDARSGDCLQRTKDAMAAMVSTVTEVRKATGARMFLHLDHCDDPKLLAFALEVGFDSIMADGSGKAFEANVRFTRQAVEMSRGTGVPVEGEVGAIDLDGSGKFARTLVEEARRFVDLSRVQYLGINIGQFHGCDYGFNRAREAYRSLVESLDENGAAEVRELLAAGRELDRELSRLGHAPMDESRRTVRDIMTRAAGTRRFSFERLLQDLARQSPLVDLQTALTLELTWRQRLLEAARSRSNLIASVVGDGAAKTVTSRNAVTDFALLRQISSNILLLGAQPVIHGGSSFKPQDLSRLGAFNVARVNFGTAPLKSYLNCLAIRRGIDLSTTPNALNPINARRLFQLGAGDWQAWLGEGLPSELQSFKTELQSRYFKILAGGASRAQAN